MTVVASPLRKAGLIDYTRGRIRLRDVEGTEEGSLRVLRHGQGPLSAASFRLAISFETSMSALGQKRTCLFALHMSAFDPKRTSKSQDSGPLV